VKFDIPPGAITYQLVIELRRPVCVAVGRLGEVSFPAGTYVYTGSARRGVEARVRRHVSPQKRLHWHIDYLLANPQARVVEIRTFFDEECVVNRRTSGDVVVPGFGASDCHAGCGAHLKRMR
jgi:Uri superfamily endonuclease